MSVTKMQGTFAYITGIRMKDGEEKRTRQRCTYYNKSRKKCTNIKSGYYNRDCNCVSRCSFYEREISEDKNIYVEKNRNLNKKENKLKEKKIKIPAYKSRVMLNNKVTLKNLTSGEIKKYKMLFEKNSGKKPLMTEKCLYKRLGDIIICKNVSYKIIEVED